MNMPVALKKELNALSKELFGVSSKWMSLYKKGQPELITRKLVETIPGDNGAPSSTKESLVPVLTKDGVKQYRQKYFSLEEIHNMLLSMKKTKDETIKTNIDKQKQKEIEEKVQKQAGN